MSLKDNLKQKTIKTIHLFDKILDVFAHHYIYVIIFVYVLYISIFIGLLSVNPNYLRWFSSTMQLLIGLFLVIRFNPFRQAKLRPGDSRIIYSSGLFLLINLGATEFFIKFYDDIRDSINRRLSS